MENQDYICFIDDIACNRFEATLLHRDIKPVTVINHDEWLENALQPIDLKDSTFSYSEITLKYFVEGSNEKDTLKNISNLIKAHLKAVIRFSDLNNLKFNSKLKSSTPEHIKDQFYELTVVLQSDFKLDAEKSVTLNKDTEFNCSSDVNTPAILTITSEADVKNVKIELNEDEYVFESIKAGDVIEINGDDYSILVNGNSNPDIVELWGFPVLVSGSNNFAINNNKVSVKIAYVERFI